MSATTAATASGTQKHEPHGIPLWGLFLALLALTAAEVGLYEFWRGSAEQVNGVTQYFMPKYAIVLLILVFTIPKALIVLIFFMHLKFEPITVITLAVLPFFMVFIAVLPILTDITTLKARALNKVNSVGHYTPDHDDEKALQKAPEPPADNN